MKNRAFIFFLSFILPLVQIHANPDNLTQIDLVSEEWPRATNSDGTGLYWDIFRYVYEPVGVKVNPLTLPYEAATRYVQRGRADAWVGSYINEREFPLYPNWHFDVDPIAVMFIKDKQSNFDGPKSFAHKKVAWIKGYRLDHYFDVDFVKYELKARINILRMLKRGRLDYFLDSRVDMELAREAFYPNDQSLIIYDLFKLKLYPAFSNTDSGHALRRIWDERMAKIHMTNKMKSIFNKWKYDYPFDDSE